MSSVRINIYKGDVGRTNCKFCILIEQDINGNWIPFYGLGINGITHAEKIIAFLEKVRQKYIDWSQVAIENRVANFSPKEIDTFKVLRGECGYFYDFSYQVSGELAWEWKCKFMVSIGSPCLLSEIKSYHYKLPISICQYEKLYLFDDLILKLKQLIKEEEKNERDRKQMMEELDKEIQNNQKIDSLFK